jgi:Rrf2 family protein
VFKISRKVEYALIVLQHLSHQPQGQLTTVKEVCDKYGAPFEVVAKVMQQLASHKILKSEQGAHGGYLVQCDLSKFSFFNLVEIIEGPVGLVKCLHNEQAPNCELFTNCNIISPLSFLNERLIQFYRDLTLSDLLKSNRRNKFTAAAGSAQGQDAKTS